MTDVYFAGCVTTLNLRSRFANILMSTYRRTLLYERYPDDAHNRCRAPWIDACGAGHYLFGAVRAVVAVLRSPRPGALFHRDFLAARPQIFSAPSQCRVRARRRGGGRGTDR